MQKKKAIIQMPNSSIQDKILNITVTGCNNLMRTEWLSKQDPYICLEYGNQKCRTRVSKDGDKNPSFHDKFSIKLIEGIREINVNVWNKNVVSRDCFIAGGKIQLARVLSEGHDDRPWPLLSQTNRSAGEVNVIMHYDDPESKEKKETQSSPQGQVWPVFGPPSPLPPSPTPTFNWSYSTPLPNSYYCYTCGIIIYGPSDYYYHQYHQLKAYTPPPPPPAFYHGQPGPSQPYPPYGPYPPPSPSHHYWR